MGLCCGKEIKYNIFEKQIVTKDENKIDLKSVNEKDVKYFSFSGKRLIVKPCNIYDGDTFSILFEWKGEIIKYRCRCLGYDTPEMKPSLKDPNREKEKEKAKEAKRRFEELLAKGKDGFVEVECSDFDKYGRILVTVYNGIDHKSINDIMIQEGHGLVYDGGKKNKFEFSED
jgi:endonuclease YncB( thermonuclease family)